MATAPLPHLKKAEALSRDLLSIGSGIERGIKHVQQAGQAVGEQMFLDHKRKLNEFENGYAKLLSAENLNPVERKKILQSKMAGAEMLGAELYSSAAGTLGENTDARKSYESLYGSSMLPSITDSINRSARDIDNENKTIISADAMRDVEKEGTNRSVLKIHDRNLSVVRPEAGTYQGSDAYTTKASRLLIKRITSGVTDGMFKDTDGSIMKLFDKNLNVDNDSVKAIFEKSFNGYATVEDGNIKFIDEADMSNTTKSNILNAWDTMQRASDRLKKQHGNEFGRNTSALLSENVSIEDYMMSYNPNGYDLSTQSGARRVIDISAPKEWTELHRKEFATKVSSHALKIKARNHNYKMFLDSGNLNGFTSTIEGESKKFSTIVNNEINDAFNEGDIMTAARHESGYVAGAGKPSDAMKLQYSKIIGGGIEEMKNGVAVLDKVFSSMPKNAVLAKSLMPADVASMYYISKELNASGAEINEVVFDDIKRASIEGKSVNDNIVRKMLGDDNWNQMSPSMRATSKVLYNYYSTKNVGDSSSIEDSMEEWYDKTLEKRGTEVKNIKIVGAVDEGKIGNFLSSYSENIITKEAIGMEAGTMIFDPKREYTMHHLSDSNMFIAKDDTGTTVMSGMSGEIEYMAKATKAQTNELKMDEVIFRKIAKERAIDIVEGQTGFQFQDKAGRILSKKEFLLDAIKEKQGYATYTALSNFTTEFNPYGTNMESLSRQLAPTNKNIEKVNNGVSLLGSSKSLNSKFLIAMAQGNANGIDADEAMSEFIDIQNSQFVPEDIKEQVEDTYNKYFLKVK